MSTHFTKADYLDKSRYDLNFDEQCGIWEFNILFIDALAAVTINARYYFTNDETAKVLKSGIYRCM